jgi:acyl carrier protein
MCTPPWATTRDWEIFACSAQARRFWGALFLAKELSSEPTPPFFREDASERARHLAPTHFSSRILAQGEAQSVCPPRHFQIRTDFMREFEEMLGQPAGSLTADTEMLSLEHWDSVDYLSAMVLIDENLSVHVQPELFSRAQTFGDILAAIDAGLEK